MGSYIRAIQNPMHAQFRPLVDDYKTPRKQCHPHLGITKHWWTRCHGPEAQH